MTPRDLEVLAVLAPGDPVSGQYLAERLGVSRNAVWKHIRALRDAGLPVRGRAGVGYCLHARLQMLDAECIRRQVAGSGIGVEVTAVTGSTNRDLQARDSRHRVALLAEYQTAGQGRRGRRWLAPPACGLCLSFGYRFETGLPRLGALSLVAGLAAAEAVEAASGIRPGLKWPNDLVLTEPSAGKLGGLLVEISGAADGPCTAIIGVGINVHLPPETVMDQAWADLSGAGGCDRNALAAHLIRALDRACTRFQAEGFAPFRDAWAARDVLAGRPVQVAFGAGPVCRGVAAGVSAGGGLWLEGDDGRREISAGEVRVRAE